MNRIEIELTRQTPLEYATTIRPAQKRLLLAMKDRRPKKWRALYRDAKVRHWDQLPFALAKPTLTGSEVLTDLGRAVKALLCSPASPTKPEEE